MHRRVLRVRPGEDVVDLQLLVAIPRLGQLFGLQVQILYRLLGLVGEVVGCVDIFGGDQKRHTLRVIGCEAGDLKDIGNALSIQVGADRLQELARVGVDQGLPVVEVMELAGGVDPVLQMQEEGENPAGAFGAFKE